MSRVRIIGGLLRSRLIEVEKLSGLRPTPDRVRETLFNWLGQDLTGRACLDLFAGSGILGFEAASRGASRVVLIERDQHTAAALRRNAEALSLTAKVEIKRADAVEFIGSTSEKFDVVFIDPPYHQGWIEKVISKLGDVLQPGGHLYVEAEQSLDALPGWHALRKGRAGQVHFHLLTPIP